MRTGSAGRAFDRFLLGALAERNVALAAPLIELLLTPTWKRIQRQLLRLDEVGLGDEGDGWIRLSQADLAMLTASTRATVNRVLSDSERRGVVDVGRGRVRDRPGLARQPADGADHARRSPGRASRSRSR